MYPDLTPTTQNASSSYTSHWVLNATARRYASCNSDSVLSTTTLAAPVGGGNYGGFGRRYAEKMGQVIDEIIESERSYNQRLYDVIFGYLKQPMPPDLSANEDRLFGNIQDVYTISKKLLQELARANGQPHAVADCFLTMCERLFQVYSVYCLNFPHAMQLLNGLNSEQVQRWLRDQQLRLCHRLPLSAYLLEPVQRITRYHLLLEKLMTTFQQYSGSGNNPNDPKTTAASLTNGSLKPSRTWTRIERHLISAFEVMRDNGSRIDRLKRNQEQKLKMQQIQASLYGWPFQYCIQTAFGELLLEDELRVGTGTKITRYAILFELVFIVAKRVQDSNGDGSQQLICKHVIPIHQMEIKSDESQSVRFTVNKTTGAGGTGTLGRSRGLSSPLSNVTTSTTIPPVAFNVQSLTLNARSATAKKFWVTSVRQQQAFLARNPPSLQHNSEIDRISMALLQAASAYKKGDGTGFISSQQTAPSSPGVDSNSEKTNSSLKLARQWVRRRSIHDILPDIPKRIFSAPATPPGSSATLPSSSRANGVCQVESLATSTPSKTTRGSRILGSKLFRSSKADREKKRLRKLSNPELKSTLIASTSDLSKEIIEKLQRTFSPSMGNLTGNLDATSTDKPITINFDDSQSDTQNNGYVSESSFFSEDDCSNTSIPHIDSDENLRSCSPPQPVSPNASAQSLEQLQFPQGLLNSVPSAKQLLRNTALSCDQTTGQFRVPDGAHYSLRAHRALSKDLNRQDSLLSIRCLSESNLIEMDSQKSSNPQESPGFCRKSHEPSVDAAPQIRSSATLLRTYRRCQTDTGALNALPASLPPAGSMGRPSTSATPLPPSGRSHVQQRRRHRSRHDQERSIQTDESCISVSTVHRTPITQRNDSSHSSQLKTLDDIESHLRQMAECLQPSTPSSPPPSPPPPLSLPPPSTPPPLPPPPPPSLSSSSAAASRADRPVTRPNHGHIIRQSSADQALQAGRVPVTEMPLSPVSSSTTSPSPASRHPRRLPVSYVRYMINRFQT